MDHLIPLIPSRAHVDPIVPPCFSWKKRKKARTLCALEGGSSGLRIGDLDLDLLGIIIIGTSGVRMAARYDAKFRTPSIRQGRFLLFVISRLDPEKNTYTVCSSEGCSCGSSECLC